ncbi:MAG: hypothetical protein K5882_08175 [Bacteroidales bacterium]|nr:hypothetical protein [Bacteroidales bacterium]
MNKLRQKKQQILRLLLGMFSFTAVMLVFQACYGPPQGRNENELVDEEIYVEQDTLNAENVIQEDSAYTLENDDKE